MSRRLKVYRNVTRQQWSLLRDGRLAEHAHRLVLSDCTLVVSPAGRDRVRRERRKNVHAYVLAATARTRLPVGTRDKLVQLYYNPYRVDEFVRAAPFFADGTAEPVYHAKVVVCDHDGTLYGVL